MLYPHKKVPHRSTLQYFGRGPTGMDFTTTTITRRRMAAVGSMGLGLLLIRPKIGYGDVGLEGQSIYAAETTGRTNEIVVLTQTENGNSNLRTADINGDGSTTIGRRVDGATSPAFTALDLGSNQTQASTILGTLEKEADVEDTSDFATLTDAQRATVEEEPFHPYGVQAITTISTSHPAFTKDLTSDELQSNESYGILAGQAQLGSITLEVTLRPASEEADHLNQLDVTVNENTWTLASESRFLGTASVYARGNERPFIVADTEDNELMVWQAGDTGWEDVEVLTDAEPNSARLNAKGELVAWRNNGTVLEPVVLRDNDWKAGSQDQRRKADAGAIPVRNGAAWLTTDTDGNVKAIDVEPG